MYQRLPLSATILTLTAMSAASHWRKAIYGENLKESRDLECRFLQAHNLKVRGSNPLPATIPPTLTSTLGCTGSARVALPSLWPVRQGFGHIGASGRGSDDLPIASRSSQHTERVCCLLHGDVSQCMPLLARSRDRCSRYPQFRYYCLNDSGVVLPSGIELGAALVSPFRDSRDVVVGDMFSLEN
jgi:hypothetical protein